MRVCLADGTALAVWDVMSENDIVEGELDGRAVGKMGDRE